MGFVDRRRVWIGGKVGRGVMIIMMIRKEATLIYDNDII